MEIALVRHGQTDWNAAGRLQGTTDIPLNATGREQAHEAGGLLAGQGWQAVAASSLERASVTASIIAERLGIPVVGHSAQLIERAYGEAEGLTKDEAIARFGSDIWPGEEPYEALTQRALRAIDQTASAHPFDKLVIVTHGTFIRAFTDAVTGARTRTPENAHSVRFTGEPGAWHASEGVVYA